MRFVQTIRVRADDPSALEELNARWHESEFGVAPGYLGSRILADRDRPGEYLIEVDFESADEAALNNGRPATEQWGAKLAAETVGDAEFANYDEILNVG